MTDHVYVNADKTAVVDRLSSPAKMWRMPVAEAIRRGLLPEDYQGQARRVQLAEPVSAKPKQRRVKRK